MQQFTHISRIKQQLDPSHRELQKLQLIETWEYRKAARGNDFIIIYYPGKKFFQDSKEKDKRRDLAVQIDNGTHELESPQPMLMDENSLLLEDILAVCGDRQNEASYRKLLKQYPSPLLRSALSETRTAHVEGRIHKNKGAYFTDVVKRLSDLRTRASQ